MIKSCRLTCFVWSPGCFQVFRSVKKSSLSGPDSASPTLLGGQITADFSSLDHVTTAAPRSAPCPRPGVGTSRGSFCEGQQVGTPALPVPRWSSWGVPDRCSRVDLGRSDGGLFGQKDTCGWLQNVPHTAPTAPPPLAPTSRKVTAPFLPLIFGLPFPSATDLAPFLSLLTSQHAARRGEINQ